MTQHPWHNVGLLVLYGWALNQINMNHANWQLLPIDIIIQSFGTRCGDVLASYVLHTIMHAHRLKRQIAYDEGIDSLDG